MTKYDIKQVPRELLEEFIAKHTIILNENELVNDVSKKIRQAATVKLRTKAEVDADIAKAVRDYLTYWQDNNGSHINSLSFGGAYEDGKTLAKVFQARLSEETSD